MSAAVQGQGEEGVFCRLGTPHDCGRVRKITGLRATARRRATRTVTAPGGLSVVVRRMGLHANAGVDEARAKVGLVAPTPA